MFRNPNKNSRTFEALTPGLTDDENGGSPFEDPSTPEPKTGFRPAAKSTNETTISSLGSFNAYRCTPKSASSPERIEGTASKLKRRLTPKPRLKTKLQSTGSNSASVSPTPKTKPGAASASPSFNIPVRADVNPSKKRKERGTPPTPSSERPATPTTPDNRPILGIKSASEPTLKISGRRSIQAPAASAGKIDALIKMKLREELTTLDFEQAAFKLGSVYIFGDLDRPGSCKIGYTAKEPELRIQETCSRDPELIYKTSKFRCSYLAEQIIQKEVENFKDRSKCVRDTCSKTHREWFRMNEHDAVKIVKRWESFMKSEPYDCNGKLTVFWQDRFESMCSEMYDGDAQQILLSQRSRWERTLNPTVADYRRYFWDKERISKTRSEIAREHVKMIALLCLVLYLTSTIFAAVFRVHSLFLPALGQAALTALFLYWRLMLSIDVDVYEDFVSFFRKMPA